MKQGWEIKKLGDIVDKYNGLWKGKKPPFVKVAVIRNTNFSKDCKLRLQNIEYLDVEEKQYKTRKLFEGDIIIEKSGGSDKQPVGRPILFDIKHGEYSFSNFTSAIRVKEGLKIMPKFLQLCLYNHYLLGATFPLQSATTGIHNLDFKGYLELEVPVPSLLEQGRIVGVLDAAFAKIDALKENAQKNLENAKALFQQVLKQELTPKPNWQTKKLSEVCETITDFVAAGSFAALRENVKYNSEKDFAQLVRTTDIKSNFTKGKFVYVSKSAFDFLYRVNLDKQSIVLPNVGVNCGEVYIVNPSQLPYEHNVLGPNAILVRSDTESNEFLSYAFKGQEFQKSLLGIINSMAQPKFNKTSLKKLLVCLPDKAEQNLIEKKLHSVEQMCSQIEANAEKTIAECDALKQAVLRRAFNGEL